MYHYEDERWARSRVSTRLEISDHGRLIRDGILLTLKSNKERSLYVTVTGGYYLVHRLVAFEFVPGWFRGATVDHVDGDHTYNHFSNLEWVTDEENRRRYLEMRKAEHTRRTDGENQALWT